MKNIKLEICTYNMDSCLAAQNGGADRVELCASMPEGGITPSFALIEAAAKNLKIDTMVMIRPRGGDFLYGNYEFELMQRDIEVCRQLGVKGVVFGILTPEGRVDKHRNKILLDLAGRMESCFHRAIDMTADYLQSAKDIADLGFTRVLTSGAYNKATNGVENIRQIVQLVGNDLEVMAGSGVNPDNIRALYERAKPAAFHFSAKKIIAGGMLFKNPSVSMGGVGEVSEYDVALSDEKEVLRARSVINSL
ncbi:MAG: copper homeostasis protein CutC [Bacteroidales bacterium]|nr:copper homeostasis protein CutC [Bacteroidales bacterium]